MTLREFTTYFEQQINAKKDEFKVHERFSARICAMVANVNRDTKKRRKPYSEDDFISGAKGSNGTMTPEQMAEVLKGVTIALGGEVKIG